MKLLLLLSYKYFVLSAKLFFSAIIGKKLLLSIACALHLTQVTAQHNAKDSMWANVVMVNTAKTDTAYLGKLVRTVYKIHNTNPQEAAEISLEGLKLAEKSQLIHTSYVFSRMLGLIAIRSNEIAKGTHYLALALSYSNLNNNPYQTQQIAHLLAKNYRGTKHLDSALYFKDLEGLAKERIYQIEKTRALHKLEEELYTEEREIQLLLEENHKQQEVIIQQSREEYFLGAFLIVFLILAYLLFRNYRQKQVIKELQVNQKFEEIANITSHQLRAPVASILGLVSIFNKENPDDPVNKEIVQHLGKSAQELDKMLKDVVEKTYKEEDKNKKS